MFWEKEPKVKNQRAAGYIYRKKGKMPFEVIAKMTERLNAYTRDDELQKKRDEEISYSERNYYIKLGNKKRHYILRSLI